MLLICRRQEPALAAQKRADGYITDSWQESSLAWQRSQITLYLWVGVGRQGSRLEKQSQVRVQGTRAQEGKFKMKTLSTFNCLTEAMCWEGLETGRAQLSAGGAGAQGLTLQKVEED